MHFLAVARDLAPLEVDAKAPQRERAAL